MTFNKKKCLELLKYEKLVTEKFEQTLGEYDLEKYFELQNNQYIHNPNEVLV